MVMFLLGSLGGSSGFCPVFPEELLPPVPPAKLPPPPPEPPPEPPEGPPFPPLRLCPLQPACSR